VVIPRWAICPRLGTIETQNLPLYLLVQACQHLWLVAINGVYHHFAYATLTSQAWSPTSRCCQFRLTLTGSTSSLAGLGYVVRMASDQTVTRLASIPRLPPEERRVMSQEFLFITITYTTSRRTNCYGLVFAYNRGT
jgi:hypothetical protein